MMEWGKKIGKWAILVGNCPGFVGNRMVFHYNTQARGMLAEGALPEQLDDAALAFGMKMGPLAMGDLVGLDLGIQARQKAGIYDPKLIIQDALVEAGRKGQKTGAGFYDYDEKRVRRPSPTAAKIIGEVSARRGTSKREIGTEEIVNRLMLPMINEAFKILEEGHAVRPADIDVCYVHGYNFPRFRGGPMHYADAVGLPNVKSALEKMGVKPAALLKSCVDSSMTLSKYWAKNGNDILKKALAARSKL